MIITIDGPSGTGKSTVSKHLAERLGFEHLDTGAFYRAFAVHVKDWLDKEISENEVNKLLGTFCLEIETQGNDKVYLLSKKDITQELRTKEISQLSSEISIFPKVRKAIVALQREYASKKNVIGEGRDLGSVVFPKAKVKFFLTADKEIRAKRRYLELKEKVENAPITVEDVLKELEERDQRDIQRSISPLICPEDAIIIDTSELNVDQVVHQMQKIVMERTVQKNRIRKFIKFCFYKFVILSFRLIFSIFYRLKVYGRENIKEAGGIIASNHASFLDPPILAASTKVDLHFLARESLFRIPLLKNLIRALNAHPVKGGAKDFGVIKLVEKLIHQDRKVIIFPEGTRSNDGDLKPLKGGVANIIIRTGSTVYPAYIHGSYSIWNRNRRWPKFFGKIQVVFGQPIYASKYALLDKKEAQLLVTEALTQSLCHLKKWIEDGAQGPIP
jgi:cytidylate kinase